MASGAMCDHAVTLIVKRSIVAGQIASWSTPNEATAAARRFAGHSLRSGLATSAAEQCAGPGHSAPAAAQEIRPTMKYIRVGQLYKKNAASMAGL
jgi:hypothetical protein